MNAHLRQADLTRSLLTKDELRRLSRKRPGIVCADLAMIFAVIGAGLVLLVATPNPWARVVAFVLIGTRQYALCLMGHDGQHHSLLSNRRWNDRLTDWLILAPIGMCLHDMRANHMRHHRLLGSSDDPDRYLHAAENKANLPAFLFFLTGLSTFYKTVWKVTSQVRGQAQTDSTDRPPADQSGALRPFVSRRLPVCLSQIIIFAFFFYMTTPWHYLLFWVLPIYVLVFVPNEVRAFCEHAHPIVPDREADDKRLITFTAPAMERVFFSPMNMNLHAEHHLWPFLPYHQLPVAHALIQPRLSDRILIRTSYVGFLWRYLRSLPLRYGNERQVSHTPTGCVSLSGKAAT